MHKDLAHFPMSKMAIWRAYVLEQRWVPGTRYAQQFLVLYGLQRDVRQTQTLLIGLQLSVSCVSMCSVFLDLLLLTWLASWTCFLCKNYKHGHIGKCARSLCILFRVSTLTQILRIISEFNSSQISQLYQATSCYPGLSSQTCSYLFHLYDHGFFLPMLLLGSCLITITDLGSCS